MPFARITSFIRLAALATSTASLALPCLAQEQQVPAAPSSQNQSHPVPALNYAKPESHFPNPFAPYIPRHVSDPNLSNTARIDQLMHDGKLYLSLNDAIALALENNLDLAIARYNLNIADTDLLRTKAGGTPRGVSTGIVQGTPGGTSTAATGASGGGTGGTTTAAGGAGTGSGGLVTSTLGSVGSAIPSLDSFLSGRLTLDRSRPPPRNK